MSNTYKFKQLGRRKRLRKKTFITEKMMNRKCGAIDDKVDKLKALKEAERIFLKEIEELVA